MLASNFTGIYAVLSQILKKLGDGGNLLGDGVDLLGDGFDLLGDGGDPRSIAEGSSKTTVAQKCSGAIQKYHGRTNGPTDGRTDMGRC